MSVLNFPSNPSINDLYNAGNKIWQWNGTAWDIINALDVQQTTVTTGEIVDGVLNVDLHYNIIEVNLNQNITNITFSNMPLLGEKAFTLIFIADGTSRSIAWPSSIKWPSNSPPSVTSTLNKKDIFNIFTYDNGVNYYSFVTGQDM